MIGLGTFLWVQQDQITELVSKVTNPDSASKTGKFKRNGKINGVPVIVEHVGLSRNEELIVAVGTTRASRSVMIYAKSDGIVVAFAPGTGTRILRGDTIFELDAVQARLAVELAATKTQEARWKLERSQLLKQRKINSNANVDDATIIFDQARLELRRAQETLNDLKIVAPFDGVLGLPKVEIGDRVTVATPIVSLDKRDVLLVEFRIPERYSARINVGDSVSAVTPSHEQTRFIGEIESIDSRIDPLSRTVTVRATIPNEKDILRPGMSFVVERLLPGKQYSSIPELSLQWRKGESFVWLVKGDKVKKVLVTTIRRLNSTVLVSGAIKPGDLVVVEGVQRLRPGRSVIYSAPKQVLPVDIKVSDKDTTGLKELRANDGHR